MTGFDFDDLEREEVRVYKPLVVHEDAALVATPCATSGPTDEILWHGRAEVARAVAFFGPGALARPLLAYVADAADDPVPLTGGLDWDDLEAGLRADFGGIDPQRLTDDLTIEQEAFDSRLEALTDQELRAEVLGLQDWQVQAHGRLKTLEKRAAWAILGIPVTDDRAAIARAFKRRALELHPDKGGDPERFQLLQELKELLVARNKNVDQDDEERQQEDVDTAAEEDTTAEVAEDSDSEGDGEDEDSEDGEGEDEEDGLTDLEDDDENLDEEEKQKRRRRRRRRRRRARANQKKKEESDDDLDDLQQDPLFDRERYEAARLKIHRHTAALWERTGRLAAEVRRAGKRNPGSRAVREFRKFVDAFASKEVSKVRKGEQKRAEALLRQFLELGTEMLVAAGAVDPVATLAAVAVQVTGPILSTAPSPTLRRRSGALLEAVESLSAGCRRYTAPMALQNSPQEAVTPAEEDPPAEAEPQEQSSARAFAEEAERRRVEELRAREEEEARERVEEERQQALEDAAAAAAAAAEAKERQQAEEALAAAAAAAQAEAARRAEEAAAAGAAPGGGGEEDEDFEWAPAAAEADAENEQACGDIVVAKTTKGPEQRLQPLRKKWDLFWDHPCAGDRRDDGSGIFCCACDHWVVISDPYDHEFFQQHCAKAGHENWIYGRLGEHAAAIGY